MARSVFLHVLLYFILTMIRDPPPSLDHSPNLRGLSLQPSAVIKARPTIIHPQLRDLILPLERGKILYPRGNSIEELTFSIDPEGDEDEDEDGMEIEEGPTRTVSHPGGGIWLIVDPRFKSDIVQIELHT
jgi:hypothetical protein